MPHAPTHGSIRSRWPEPPAFGEPFEVAPGILWLRLPLPFLLDHVNVYLIEDEGGWAALDTGIGTEPCRAAWETALSSRMLRGRRLTQVICTHCHPDHLGLVGWLCSRFDCRLAIPRTEFLLARVLQASVFAASPAFYTARGVPPAEVEDIAVSGHGYLKLVTGLPVQYDRLLAGQTFKIGGRLFEIFAGGGHSLEQAMLFCASENLFFSADQVLPKITPNIGVWSMEPEADPLREYLASLSELRREMPGGALVLPGHHLPFHGLQSRIGELQAHHAARCAAIEAAVRAAPHTAAELVPVLFTRQMDAHQTGFAFGEVVAHVNYMVRRGDLRQETDADGVQRLLPG